MSAVALLLTAHAILAVVVPLCVRRWGAVAFWLAALGPAATAGWLVGQLPDVHSGGVLTTTYSWAPSLGLEISGRLDALAAVMLILVSGIGVVVLAYARWYFGRDDPALPRVAGGLVAFAGAMTGLVLVDNLLLLYVFWELTTVCSFLLIGQADTDAEARRAASRALLATTGLGMPMLLGFVLLGESAGTYRISELVAAPPSGPVVTVAVVLVLAGAFAKAAQVPMHSWLPAAMVASTPVSAYLHAAAMVKAGPYLVARLAPGFADLTVWQQLVVSVGLASLVLGGWRALRQDDLKLLLAFGTVSQLGLLIALFGTGTHTAAVAGMAMLLAHGLFKAPLFLVVGAIEQRTHTRSIGELAGLARQLPVLFAVALAAGASMIGLPPFLGYVGKEATLEAFVTHGPDLASRAALVAVVVGSVLTVAYSLRFLHGGFGGGDHTGHERQRALPIGWLLCIAVPALAGLLAGIAVSPVGALAERYAATLPAAGPPYELALWHGFTPTLVLTGLIFAAGALIQLVRRPVAAFQRQVSIPLASERVLDLVGRGIVRLAAYVTGRTQVGSLPIYLLVIIVTVLAIPGIALVLGVHAATIGPSWSAPLPLWDTPLQVVLGAVALVSAVAAARTVRRLSAILFLGLSGYAVGGLFIVHGAPDLALAMFLVDTLTLVILVLVLRRIPRELPRGRSRSLSVAGTVVAGLVGVLVSTLLVTATSVRTGGGGAPDHLEQAARIGASNAVNAILTDFRALDTLGEITVLLIAALGVASIVLHSEPLDRTAEEAAEPENIAEPRSASPQPGVARAGHPPVGPRTIFFEVTARVITPATLMFSVYLLFAGHHHPGGGFVAGLVAGMAFVLRYFSGGVSEYPAATWLRPSLLLGTGLTVAVAAGTLPLLTGRELLENLSVEFNVVLLGSVELTTALALDVGVYILVIGLVRMLLNSLGVRLTPAEPVKARALEEERT